MPETYADPPYIPEYITVHLGTPNDSSADNVTLSFRDYIKNSASSELYPTWPEAALRANIYAIISFALNRVYTEWYRSRGYDFDVTNTTQYDQSFVYGREIYEPISRIVDEIFNNYISRQGSIEPLFAVYCDGRQVNCRGLTQWGTVDLANRGYTPYEILTYFYGNDIDIVTAAVRPGEPSYPGKPLSLGSGGNDVRRIKNELNRISNNYPAIPKIYSSDSVFDASTENAVRAFQEIFDLPATGVVDKATWYKINYIFVSVKKLAELSSEGLTESETLASLPRELKAGDSGQAVSNAQYYLAVVGAYYSSVLPIEITGEYDRQTADSVRSFQKTYGLPETGVIDRRTWNDLFDAYAGIVENVPLNIESEGAVLYPGTVLVEGTTSEYVRVIQEFLSYIHQTYPNIPDVSATGYFGPVTRSAVSAYQRQFGLPVSGNVGADTWRSISDTYYTLRYGAARAPGQNPGYIIS